MKVFYVLFLLPLTVFAGMPGDGHPEEPPKGPSSWEQVLKAKQVTDVDTNVFTKTEVENHNTNILKAEGGEGGDAHSFAKAEGGDADAYAKVGDVSATGGQGGAGGDGGSVGDTTATGGNVGDINVTGGGVSINNKYPRQAPMAYAPDVFPSSDKCDSGGFSIALTSTLGGLAAGKGKGKPTKTPSDDCLFSLSQQWMAMGAYGLACQALMATRSGTYAHTDKEACKSLTGPAPQGFAQAPQPSIVVVPIAVPQGQTLTVEHLERAFKHAMENK